MQRIIYLLTAVLLSGPGLFGQVAITETEHLGRTHHKIVTKTATYLYDPVAGGFSSILDAAGKDWIAFQDEPWGEYPASAASSYRGLPNLVFQGEDDGAGHPGHDKCESTVLNNRISTVTKSGKWAWSWTFFDTYAELQVTTTDEDRPYWFLYEGPAGGVYRPKQTVWGTDVSGPNYERFDHYKGSKHTGNYQWFYFNGPDSPHTFWMAQLSEDERSDHYSLLGSEKTGVDSADGMVVAGFGRGDAADPKLSGPNIFKIGFFRKPVNSRGRHRSIGRMIKKLLR